jgi:hypothetical protein
MRGVTIWAGAGVLLDVKARWITCVVFVDDDVKFLCQLIGGLNMNGHVIIETLNVGLMIPSDYVQVHFIII